MPNELGYFTLPVKDLARAKRFYGELFGWKFEEGGHVANTKFPLGLSANGPAELPNVYFRVDDIDAAAARVSQARRQRALAQHVSIRPECRVRRSGWNRVQPVAAGAGIRVAPTPRASPTVGVPATVGNAKRALPIDRVAARPQRPTARRPRRSASR